MIISEGNHTQTFLGLGKSRDKIFREKEQEI